MNLVGPGDSAHHFIDSACAVSGISARGRWADLGSGAGFPGIAMAARHPSVQVLLVESRQKRAHFLKQVLREAKIVNAEVFLGRTEDVEGPFDGVISRAYRPPADYLLDAHRLLKADGVAVLLSGETPQPFDGWVVVDSHRYTVPDGQRMRTMLRRA